MTIASNDLAGASNELADASSDFAGASSGFAGASSDSMGAESRARSFAKGLTWRAVATLTTMAIVWVITSDIQIAVEIGAIEVVAKVAVYYAHERAWLHIPFGRAP